MPAAPTGAYRATVRAFDGARARITITRLGGENVYLARILLPVGAPDAAFGATSIPVGDGSLALRPLQAGDEVLVVFLEGDQDRPVVIGRLA